MQAVKAKITGTAAAVSTKKDLVMSNYVQFLAAKMTLDDINRKFLSTKENGDFLEDLEESMK